MSNFDEYQLRPKYMEKFVKRSKLFAILMVYTFNITYFVSITGHAALFIVAYFDPNVYHSIVVNIIWQVIFSLSTYHTLSLLYIYVYIIYAFSIYMKYRFKQIGDYLDIYARKGTILKVWKVYFIFSIVKHKYINRVNSDWLKYGWKTNIFYRPLEKLWCNRGISA